ncbi:unnamed protein product [Chrysoparadoxa australica]
MVFLGTPDDVQKALGKLTYQSFVTNRIDTVTISIWDGAEGLCLAERKYRTFSLRQGCGTRSCSFDIGVRNYVPPEGDEGSPVSGKSAEPFTLSTLPIPFWIGGIGLLGLSVVVAYRVFCAPAARIRKSRFAKTPALPGFDDPDEGDPLAMTEFEAKMISEMQGFRAELKSDALHLLEINTPEKPPRSQEKTKRRGKKEKKAQKSKKDMPLSFGSVDAIEELDALCTPERRRRATQYPVETQTHPPALHPLPSGTPLRGASTSPPPLPPRGASTSVSVRQEFGLHKLDFSESSSGPGPEGEIARFHGRNPMSMTSQEMSTIASLAASRNANWQPTLQELASVQEHVNMLRSQTLSSVGISSLGSGGTVDEQSTARDRGERRTESGKWQQD